MKKITLLAAFGFICACAGTLPPEQTTPKVDITPECKPFTGRFPPVTPGVSELRGSMEVPRELEGQTVYVALDYSTGDGNRQSVAVGSIEPTGRTMRFHCMIASPPDAAFWKWVLLAPPVESCGYYAESDGAVETAVSVTCEASRVFAWDAYKELFRQ